MQNGCSRLSSVAISYWVEAVHAAVWGWAGPSQTRAGLCQAPCCDWAADLPVFSAALRLQESDIFACWSSQAQLNPQSDGSP